MKKRILRFRMTAKAVMIALLMGTIGIIPGVAQSFTVGDLNYTVNTDGISVAVAGHINGTSATGILNIPESVTYDEMEYTVTTIGVNAFRNCNGLTSVVIPSSISRIGSYAFYQCSGFNTIYFNALNCEDISISNSNTAPFKYCTGSLVIGDGVSKIPSYMFYAASFTGNLTIPDSVTSIGDGAFQQSSFTGSLVIGNSVLTIGSMAFYGCGFSGNLTIGGSVITIGNSAFHSCQFVGNLIIPNTVSTIGDMAFCGCNGFSGSLYIPNSVTVIGNSAFMECSGFIGSFVLPNSVTTIGDYAFSGCSGFYGDLIIPNTITEINDGVFQECRGFSGSLIIPNSVSSIGSRAFLQCTGFTGSLNIPSTVTAIGEEAFFNCNGFTGSLSIPNSVTTIGSQAFCSCSGISSISIPESVIDLYGNAFNETGWYENQAEGYLYLNNWCLGYKGTEKGTLIIHEGIKHIANQAFLHRSRFEGNLKLPKSLQTIGISSFSSCSGLTGKLLIPKAVTTIGRNAFYNCVGLTSIEITSSTTSIGIGAFIYCDGITSLIVLAVTTPPIGYGAFYSVDKSIPVYVPYGAIDDYATSSGWNEFTNYQEIAYKSITAYGENDGWQFIASPLAENTAPTTIDNMLPTAGTFDFYRFDQSENAEWRNYKANSFSLANGQGYLYANQEDVNLIFKGSFNEGTSQEVSLTYDGMAQFAGWNLVGNPFPYAATVSRSYYVMNENGTAIEPTPLSSGSTIAACTGIMVKADGANESVTFSKATRQVLEDKGLLYIALSQVVERPLNLSKGGVSLGSTTAAIDKAIVSFNAEDALAKFVFNAENAQISIPQGGKDYAIATVGRDAKFCVSTMPLNFKAAKNGTYTISVNPDNVELDYLHLIDNLTGAEVDMLASPTYTFTAKTTDYASRFRLVFSTDEDVCEPKDAPFAYISNGEIILAGAISAGDAGTASLQIVDAMGRICRDAMIASPNHRVSTTGMASGVYVLRLINGNDVKTQKIVID